MEPQVVPADYAQQKWQSSDGLPRDSIQTVVQTRDGFLWIATERGLARFDGLHFSTFNRSSTPELNDNYIGSLFEARDGTLWIGTSLNGLTAYKDGRFRSVPLPISGQQGGILFIQQDDSGTLWLGTSSHGVLRIRDGSVASFGAESGLAGNALLSMLVDHRGVLWVATEQGGLQRWNGQRFVSSSPSDGLAGKKILVLFEDRQSTLWVTTGRSIVRLKTGPDSDLVLSRDTAARRVNALYTGRGQNVWVGTEGGGLELHHAGAVTYFNSRTGLPSDTVQSLFKDREGSLWLGTDGGGLVQLRGATFKTYSRVTGSGVNDVRAITAGPDASVWIGTDDGLSRWERGRVTKYDLDSSVQSKDCRALLLDHEGTLWIGTDGAGLLRLPKGATAPKPVPDLLPHSVIMALAEDTQHQVWVGTPQGLVQVRDGKARLFTTHSGLPGDVILTLSADPRGGLWIGTSHGLASIDSLGKVRSFGSAQGMIDDAVFSTYEDSLGIVWVGTYEGLFRWDGMRSIHLTTREGLLSNAITDIQGSTQGDLWLRSNSEISRVSRSDLDRLAAGTLDQLHPTSYNGKDGILTTISGGGQPGSIRLDDGTLWFTSIQGLVSLDPARLRSSSLAPPVKITEAIVDGRSADTRSQTRLAPGAGSLEFHFAALSFVDPANVRFKYQLAGFDKGWIDAGTRTAAYYTNIPPGSYTFRVIACNRDGVWNLDGASYAFTLLAHFYQTVPFYLLCATGMLLLASFAYRSRVRNREANLVSRQRELEGLVAQRTGQLEEEKRQLVSAREALRQQSRLDGLTGLLNRVAILELLDREITRACRTGHPLSVVMVDIDHFKAVNDTHGHLTGDEVIRQVSTRLGQAVRPYDAVGRYGGEEFLIVMPDFNAIAETSRLESVRQAIARDPVASGDMSIPVTCSFGVNLLQTGNQHSAEALLEAADRALYEAKHQGRNRVAYGRVVQSADIVEEGLSYCP